VPTPLPFLQWFGLLLVEPWPKHEANNSHPTCHRVPRRVREKNGKALVLLMKSQFAKTKLPSYESKLAGVGFCLKIYVHVYV
jgi:hypothetical protein